MGVQTQILSTQKRLVVGGLLLFLCKSFAPAILAGLACPIIWFLSSKAIARVAIITAVLVIAYPLSRAEQVFPAQVVTEVFYDISPDRGQSLAFRFYHEDSLLKRAMERPLTGWGSFNRRSIFSETDGRELSVSDGYWIILLGSFGYVGFACFFALMLAPLVRFARNQKYMSGSAQAGAAALAVLVALFTIDLLPNARSDNLSVLYAGILWTVSYRFAFQRGATPDDAGGKVAPPRRELALRTLGRVPARGE
jgi:hypothetical protein